ncbi:hypothetical protein [Halorarius halobius]|uniref:hypothetical protein n=1 Tax=Halorarius halobius TaxID=2962671 RepID=UPI0020CF7CA1|nr:hypothetical protein [Halorarius halobius]
MTDSVAETVSNFWGLYLVVFALAAGLALFDRAVHPVLLVAVGLGVLFAYYAYVGYRES